MAAEKQTVVARHDGFFLVSTAFIYGTGWETAVFRCDVAGEVNDWMHLQMDRHGENEQYAMSAHKRVVEEWRAGHEELPDDE